MEQQEYTGNIVVSYFPETPTQQTMERALLVMSVKTPAGIVPKEFAFFLNVADDEAIFSVHHVVGREGNKPIIDRNVLAQTPCAKVAIENAPEVEFEQLKPVQFDGITIEGFCFTKIQEAESKTAKNLDGSPKTSRWRVAKPKFAAMIRAKQDAIRAAKVPASTPAPEAPAPAGKRGRKGAVEDL